MDFDNDVFLKMSRKIIVATIKVLASIMILVIFWSVADVVLILYQHLMEPPRFLLDPSDLIAIFGAFMIVLIAIEIFINIVVYLRNEIIHVRIVLATAIVAIARKVIVFDFENIESEYVWATSSVIIALCVGYWVTGLRSKGENEISSITGIED